MNKFSEAFAKAQDVVKNQKFETAWQKFLKEDLAITALFDAAGPDISKAEALDKIRKKISDSSRNAFTAFFAGGGVADTIIAACKNGTTDAKLAERAATIKMLKHLYLSTKRGAQDVWTYSPPKSFTKWVYDEITGDERMLKSKLSKDSEIYSASDRKTMCEALSLALEWSMYAVAQLGTPTDETKNVIKRWFADDSTTDAQITSAAATLKEGFQKIANAANSNKVVFSDEPIDRNKGGWKDWGFIYTAEAMNVVYIQGAFLKAGNSSKAWQCALTIVHELSHKVASTKDNRYDFDGLKPCATFPHAKAIENADSWAHFATDLKGRLSRSDLLNALG